jgi:hypothetical protein
VPWLRRLVTGLSPRRPGFLPGLVYVGYMGDKLELKQGSVWVLQLSSDNIILPPLHAHISSRARFLKLWYAGHCSVAHGLSKKKNKRIKILKNLSIN